jgi:hypothetical protein
MAVLNLSVGKLQAPSLFVIGFLSQICDWTKLLFFDFLPRWHHHFLWCFKSWLVML